MKSVLVAGAAGGIGESVVRALLASGETAVIATSRSAERLEALQRRLGAEAGGHLTVLAGDAGDFAGAESLAARAAALGPIDAAVAILGRGWWTSGALLELAPADWTSVLAEMLTGHFAFARAVVPLLAGGAKGLYLSLGGGAAFEPTRDAGLVSVAAAGQLMLTRVLARERPPAGPRILELLVNGPVNTPESAAFADAAWIRAEDVGRVVTELVLHGVTTWPALRAGDPVIVMNPLDP